MNGFSTKMADFFVREKIIRKEEYEICRYGLEIVIDNIAVIIKVVFIGLLLRRALITGVYLAVFCSLRGFTGGYHARTKRGCHTATFVGYLLFLSETELLTEKCGVSGEVALDMGLAYFICFWIILWLSPVEHYSKILTETEKRKNRKNALGELIFLGGVIVILYSSLPEVSCAILVTLIEVALLMIIGRRENDKRKKNYQADC